MLALVVYNFLWGIALLLCWPLLLGLVLLREKYRKKTLTRLGFGLHRDLAGLLLPKGQQRIWIHALSVGEVTSALPLVRGLRERFPDTQLIFSAATSSGLKIAREQIAPLVDRVIAAPLDLYPVMAYYIRTLRPNLFCLVETDFWPNWLTLLRRAGCRMLLVNGRISQASRRRYERFSFFFTPLFNTFDLLAMQSGQDRAGLCRLGVDPEKIVVLGNLKYDAVPERDQATNLSREALRLHGSKPLWICGSTHPGEEAIILQALAQLHAPRPQLLLAPRDTGRAPAIAALARGLGFTCRLRTESGASGCDIFILDTLGELARCYPLGQLAFIGGSLVAAGGHNPLEAATCGLPVLFGPHMEDFQEISDMLVQCGGGCVVDNADDLAGAVAGLLDPAPERQLTRNRMASAALALVAQQRGVVQRHLQALDKLLAP